jgi:hypothetical protein
MKAGINGIITTSAWDRIIQHFFLTFTGPVTKIFLDPAGGWQLFIDRLMAMTVWSFAELHRKHRNANGPGLPRVPWQDRTELRLAKNAVHNPICVLCSSFV